MKVAIGRKIILDALLTGGSAALSTEAQEDGCALSLFIKSVKITVSDKDLVVESGNNLIHVKKSVSIVDEPGIKVTEPGCVVVPAKELLNFINAQGEDAIIGFSLQRLVTPEVINPSAGVLADGEPEKEEVLELRKIGHLKLVSKSAAKGSKTSGKWELDCYEESKFSSANFGISVEKHFEINGTRMIEALDSVTFASAPKDHVLGSASIQVYNGELYFVTTDNSRCAVYKIPKDDVKNITSTRQLLIPCNLLDQVSKIIDKEDSLTFSYNEETNRVFISQSSINIRLACTDKNKIAGFPSLEKLLVKEYKQLAGIQKYTLNELLKSASLVNRSAALFAFNKENSSVIIKAISEEGKYKPVVKQASIDSASRDINLIWAVKSIGDGLKIVKSDSIVLSIPENLKSLRLSGAGNDNFIYFIMAALGTKYNVETKVEAKD